jgi:hypothetical protein
MGRWADASMQAYFPDLQRRCGWRLVTRFLTAPRVGRGRWCLKRSPAWSGISDGGPGTDAEGPAIPVPRSGPPSWATCPGLALRHRARPVLLPSLRRSVRAGG